MQQFHMTGLKRVASSSQGAQLEPALGSPAFCALIVELILTTGAFYIALAIMLSTLFPTLAPGIMGSCAVGFSGVLFGLKVVLNARSGAGWSNVYGITLPNKYVAWAELFLVQLMLPEASFWGHLAGILAGLVHVYVVSPWRHHHAVSSFFGSRQSGHRFEGRGMWGGRSSSPHQREREAHPAERRHGGADRSWPFSRTQTGLALALYCLIGWAWITVPDLDALATLTGLQLSSGAALGALGTLGSALFGAPADIGRSHDLILARLAQLRGRWYLGAFGRWQLVPPAVGGALGTLLRVLGLLRALASIVLPMAARQGLRWLESVTPGVIGLVIGMMAVHLAWWLLPRRLAQKFLGIPASNQEPRTNINPLWIMRWALAPLSHRNVSHFVVNLISTLSIGHYVEERCGPLLLWISFFISSWLGLYWVRRQQAVKPLSTKKGTRLRPKSSKIVDKDEGSDLAVHEGADFGLTALALVALGLQATAIWNTQGGVVSAASPLVEDSLRSGGTLSSPSTSAESMRHLAAQAMEGALIVQRAAALSSPSAGSAWISPVLLCAGRLLSEAWLLALDRVGVQAQTDPSGTPSTAHQRRSFGAVRWLALWLLRLWIGSLLGTLAIIFRPLIVVAQLMGFVRRRFATLAATAVLAGLVWGDLLLNLLVLLSTRLQTSATILTLRLGIVACMATCVLIWELPTRLWVARSMSGVQTS